MLDDSLLKQYLVVGRTVGTGDCFDGENDERSASGVAYREDESGCVRFL